MMSLSCIYQSYPIDMRLPIVKLSSRFKQNNTCLMKRTTPYDYNGFIDLDKVSWLKDFPWSNFPTIGLAGGFIISSLQGQFDSTQDIDLYIPKTTDSTRVLNKLLAYFLYKFDDISFNVPCDTYRWDYEVYTLKRSNDQILLQIILSPCTSMIDVVSKFDMSHLGIWIDHGGLWCLQSSYFELLHGFTNITHHTSQGRILKYAQRGFDIYGLKLELYPEKNPVERVWTSKIELPRSGCLMEAACHLGYLEFAPRFKLGGYCAKQLTMPVNQTQTYHTISMCYVKLNEDSPFEFKEYPHFIECKVNSATYEAYTNLLSTLFREILTLPDKAIYKPTDTKLIVYCEIDILKIPTDVKFLPRDTILELCIYRYYHNADIYPARPKLCKIYWP